MAEDSTKTTTTPSQDISLTAIWKEFISRPRFYVILAACGTYFLLYVLAAVEDIAVLFGWIIGASNSPISAAVAPLIFGLLATVVIVSVRQVFTSLELYTELRSLRSMVGVSDEILKRASREASQKIIVKLILGCLLMHVTVCFVFHCRYGIFEGTRVGSPPSQAAPPAPLTPATP
jgi:hypothetical protein